MSCKTHFVVLALCLGSLSAAAQETAHGPFTVDRAKWYPTGIQLQVGDEFRVKASGALGNDPACGPDGCGHWGWWVLAAKHGTKLRHVGSSGGGSVLEAGEAGELILGVPRVANILAEDAALPGAFNVMVYVRHPGGPGTPPVNPPNPPNPPPARLVVLAQDCPTEIWIGFGRPSMACTLCIRGYRTNTADPVTVAAQGGASAFGDLGNGVRVFANGASAQTYDWSGHICPDGKPGYNWGVLLGSSGNTGGGGVVAATFLVTQPGAEPATVTVPLCLQPKPSWCGGGGTYDTLGMGGCAGATPGCPVGGPPAPPTPPPPPPGGGGRPLLATLSPLKLYYSEARHDNFTTATPTGESDALSAGYRFARLEGYVLRAPEADTAPLQLYWSQARGDNYSTATADGARAGVGSGYVSVRGEGYVFTRPRPFTVPLKQFWSKARGDNFITATAQGEADAIAAGYQFVRIEGYVYEASSPMTYETDRPR